jgi:hypothetical protein
MDIPRLYHVYTSNDIPCTSVDIHGIHCVKLLIFSIITIFILYNLKNFEKIYLLLYVNAEEAKDQTSSLPRLRRLRHRTASSSRAICGIYSHPLHLQFACTVFRAVLVFFALRRTRLESSACLLQLHLQIVRSASRLPMAELVFSTLQNHSVLSALRHTALRLGRPAALARRMFAPHPPQ